MEHAVILEANIASFREDRFTLAVEQLDFVSIASGATDR